MIDVIGDNPVNLPTRPHGVSVWGPRLDANRVLIGQSSGSPGGLDRGSLKFEAWIKNRDEHGQIAFVSINAKDTDIVAHHDSTNINDAFVQIRHDLSGSSPTFTTAARTNRPEQRTPDHSTTEQKGTYASVGPLENMQPERRRRRGDPH